MEQDYSSKMSNLGYNHLICDIFPSWEDVKDEILLPERKEGEGNGTIHVFLGAADKELRKEFTDYYQAVSKGEDPSVGAIKVKHYFLASNIISMIGYLCKYDFDKHRDFARSVQQILSFLGSKKEEEGMVSTYSLFKLSTGSSRLRPYFKQFEKKGAFTELIRQILLPNSSYKISLYKNDNGDYAAFWLIGFDWQSDFEADSTAAHFHKKIVNPINKAIKPRQIIYYGTPGSGKSHKVKQDYDEKFPKHQVIRTTFHPDTDYASFVGGYKPVPITDKDGNEKITYRFVPQCFTDAYVRAWNDLNNPYFLIIEEINRGNCAQIFGDTFQLLDRDENGYSEYPIDADADLKKYLLEGKNDDGTDVLSYKHGIENGQLCLPPNLSIIATMNTSDQSLFPMDTAFKRRWAWEYVPIDYKNKYSSEFKINIGEETFEWPIFLYAINAKIKDLTSSEDKQMGNFFIKHSVDEKEFVNKVMYYLWSEIGKDNYKTSDALFWCYEDKDKSSKTNFSFNELYEEGSTRKLLDFMDIIMDKDKEK